MVIRNAMIFLFGQVGHTPIIAFLVFLFSEDTCFYKEIGLDYEHSKRTLAYFRLFYDGIDQATQRGLRFVDMGNSTTHVKAPLGCRQISTNYHILFRRFLRPLGGIMAKMLDRRFSSEPSMIYSRRDKGN